MSYKTIAVHLDAGPRCATRVVVEEAVDAVVRAASRATCSGT